MIYDHESRQKLIDTYEKQWNQRLTDQPQDVLDMVKNIELSRGYLSVGMKVPQDVYRILGQKDMTPSRMMKEYYGELVRLYVPEEKREQYFSLIDKLNQFPAYGTGSRGDSYVPFANEIFEMLFDYKVLGFYGGNLSDYLKKDLPDELLDISVHTNLYGMRHMDNLVAAALDEGDEAVIRIAHDTLCGGESAIELESRFLSGIMKSSDRALYEQAGRLLLAAGIQDGLRQMVCQAATAGTAEAFVGVFDYICENKLFRFSGVRMALMQWFNVWDSKGLELLMGKYLSSIKEALHNRNKAVELCGSSDQILIYIGLWAISVYNSDNVIGILHGFQREGTKPQLLAMAYFNQKMWSDKACRQVAQRVLHDTRNEQDMELVAAYWDAYCIDLDRYLRKAGIRKWDGAAGYVKVPLGDYFEDENEAGCRVKFLRNILDNLQGGDVRFAPCIFPWHSAKITVSQVMKQLCVHAHILGDEELTDYVLDHIKDIKKESNTGSRADYVELLLHDVSENRHIDKLVSLIADKESDTQETAARLLENVTLEESHYEMLESFLRLKNGGIRRNAIKLLSMQSKERIPLCVERLLQSGDERMQEGARSLMLEVTQEESACEEQEGYGLYKTDVHITFPQRKADRQAVISYFDIEREVIDGILSKLAELIEEYTDKLYIAKNGEEIRFDYYLSGGHRWIYDGEVPFQEVWTGFYEKEIKDVRTLTLLDLCLCDRGIIMIEQERYEQWNHTLYGDAIADYVLPETIRAMGTALGRIVDILTDIYGQGDLGQIGMEVLQWVMEDMLPEEMWYQRKQKYNGIPTSHKTAYINSAKMRKIRRAVDGCTGTENFVNRFFLYALLDDKFCFQESRGKRYDRYGGNDDLLDVLDYVKACSLGIIEEDIVYKNIFEKWGLHYTFDALGMFEGMKDRWRWEDRVQKLKGATKEEEEQFMETGHRIYTRLTERILEAELKRGDMPTDFSDSIGSIELIYGMKYFVRILMALGDEKLARHGQTNAGKKECLSHLLYVCMPQEGDSAELLRELLHKEGNGKAAVSDRRLIEAGMYAPQWLDILEKYFGICGLKSGGYYFIAHMDEWFDERRRAVIARYTPLTTEELRMGAFDSGWFRQVYAMLGEKYFGWLYDAAKYISGGAKHVRARKYADAALGKVSVERLETEIVSKRNKDSLMSYGLIPFHDKKDMLHRYDFIQQFLKESRNFGSMRRTSEALAVKMALRNMASAAGYSDTMRLSLAMESEMTKEYEKYSNSHEVKDKKLKEQSRRCISMFEQAMTEGEIFRYEELAALCENPSAGPVIRALVFIEQEAFAVQADKEQDNAKNAGRTNTEKKERRNGYITENGLMDAAGNMIPVKPDTVLRAAHPVELYQEGVLEAYQRGCYDKISSGVVRKQPFKQIFREFYVKLKEELEQKSSHMFEGYQVDARKALACLKSRGWIADAEEGIQKVCYGTDIVARIIVLSDWITVEDLMTPSIDWIDFYDRMNHEPVYVKDVPDIVYSEIMRDVDLAVSVAYVGGVDPETCRSGIEMRKVIAEYNMSLFGLQNVEFVKNHAVIKGKHGTYTVHMGSGVVHHRGGPQIYIKAVPAQRRGRIFLPFVDDDPKTAEILSKIILFAQDDKIKDPEILGQI
ncbi:MAG: DUF4132 domain-containing protein [Lachnospiraceae bacterium]|nr:DUF4132 domain-containing protein [Lachnospiraceae bacterium]